MERNIDEDIEMMEKTKEEIMRVVATITRVAESGLRAIRSRENSSVKREELNTGFRLITRNPNLKPEFINESYSQFSSHFKNKEEDEIVYAIKEVGKVIKRETKDVEEKAEKVIRVFDSSGLESEQKAEIVIRCLNSIKEKAKLIEDHLNALTYCIKCGYDFLTFSSGSLDMLLGMALRNTYSCRQLRNIKSSGNIPKNLPPVKIDVGKISEVIEYLLSEFIKGMPNGEELTRSIAQTGKNIVLQIMGKSAYLIEGFEPFYFIKNETVFNFLWFSYRRIIEAHGGSIDFQSKPEYSAFTIKLPIADS